MPSRKKGTITRNGSILSVNPVLGDKYASLAKSMSTTQSTLEVREGRHDTHDSSIHLDVDTRSDDLFDSSASEGSSSSASSSSGDGESSIISATSAVVPIEKSPLPTTQKNDSAPITKQKISSVSQLMTKKYSFSQASTSPTRRTVSKSPQRTYNMNRVSSNSSRSISIFSTLEKTRAGTPSQIYRGVPKSSSKPSTNKVSPTAMKRQSSNLSPSKAAGKLPSKPSSEPTNASPWLKGCQLSQGSSSTLDSQELYALSMVDGYVDSKEKAKIEKSTKRRAQQNQSSFESTASSVDSQELYAMRMAYGCNNADVKKLEKAKQRRAKEAAEVEAERMREERANARREKMEAAERESIRKAAEESVREAEIEAEKEAEREAQEQIARKIELQKVIEAKTEAMERELEKVQEEKKKAEEVNRGAENESQFDGECSDSDYSSEYDGGSGENKGNDDDESIADESVESKDMKDMNIITRNDDEKSIKSNVSSMSGSDGEEDDDLDNISPPSTPSTRKTTKTTKKTKSRGSTPMRKRKVLMFSKGLGKGKKKQAANSKPAKIPTSPRRTIAVKTSKTMKSTTLRAPKAKVVKKKTSSQMITIRQKGRHGASDIIPTTSADAKVMRVCKLTTRGYVSAEFTSVDPRNTPLHVACLTHYPEKFILDYLIKPDKKSNNPRSAAFTENSSGELPIHSAVMDKKGVPPAVLEALLKEHPQSVQHVNVDGSLPLHVACEVGAPSMYSITRLCQFWPQSVLTQNNLRVPLHDDDDIVEERGAPSQSIFACFDWFGDGHDNTEEEKYETGWTPLHLAAVNGAEPEVIETIIETNRECLLIKTNKGRTAMECAKWCIINAIINNVAVCKLQNTFASIQIMQAYEREMKIKDELTQKAGLVIAALENENSYGSLWRRTIEMMPKRKEEHVDKFSHIDRVNEGEVGLTNLHRVILDRGAPDEVQAILKVTPDCVNVRSSNDRTPMECAKHIIIKGLLLGKSVSSLMNTFVSLEIMQAYEDTKVMTGELDASTALSKSMAKNIKANIEPAFGSQLDNYIYTKKFLEMNESALGPVVEADCDAAVQPHEYYPPVNLGHVNLRITVPVGFRRARRALLNNKHTFLSECLLQDRLGYKK